MKEIELIQSPVQFVEDRTEGLHKYYMGFQELTGVTTILNAVIFRDKYTGIDENVLRNAANRGTAIHEAIQAYVMCQPLELDEDLQQYMGDAMEAREVWTADPIRAVLEGVAVEYLVSDCKEVATKIDVVTPAAGGEDGVDIGDIKTTYQLDEDYLSWQLSVEKYLMERQNPGLKVRRLLAYWWNRQRKQWTVKEVSDKGAVEVERLLAAWRAGEFWGLPSEQEQQVPAIVVSIASVYAELEAEAQAAEARRDEFRERLKEAMKENGVKSFKVDGFSVVYTEGSKSSKFDKKALLAARPDLKSVIEKYTTQSDRADSIRITLQ